ncbi:hypothetical protein [Phyllobacterium chamaecytisi]|uniref:hypothetical protein n=1 Tax=Phyllobacterium chamaecytisi TaxID=2876082 RepID=UPI001CCA269A|nr:hypothetical protein [Phyllobacterium sp. KW56]MBZ9606146.1 hypothetical protein [Phyllobacterium sp. KW56]
MLASVTSPKRALSNPDRWEECESAIKPRFNKIRWVDRRNDPTVQLLKDAVAAGWAERGNTSNLDAENAKGDGSGDKELASAHARLMSRKSFQSSLGIILVRVEKIDPRNCPYPLAFKK